MVMSRTQNKWVKRYSLRGKKMLVKMFSKLWVFTVLILRIPWKSEEVNLCTVYRSMFYLADRPPSPKYCL